MKKTVWDLIVRRDGETLFQGDVEALHNEGDGYVLKCMFPGGVLFEV